MKSMVSIVLAGAALAFTQTPVAFYSHPASVQQTSGQSRSQSSSDAQHRSREQTQHEQANESQDTPAHTQFGGQPRDEGARERHHQQYPESAQHLGPQDQEQGQGAGTAGGRSSTRPGHDRTAKDAVSGVGR